MEGDEEQDEGDEKGTVRPAFKQVLSFSPAECTGVSFFLAEGHQKKYGSRRLMVCGVGLFPT